MNASLYSSAMEDGSCGKKTRMENTDCTMIILSRLQKLDPENANMILGYLLLKNCQQEMIDCATGPDSLIYALISEAKACLACPVNSVAPISMQPHFDQSIPARYMPASSIVPRQFSSSSSFRVAVPGPFYDSYDASAQQQIVPNLFLTHPLFSNLNGKNLCVHNQSELFGLEEPYASNPLSPGFRKQLSLPRSSTNWYFHGQDISDGISQLHGSDINETVNEDHAFAPGTLEKLEMEIRELLKTRKGIPISIASLPMLYQENTIGLFKQTAISLKASLHGKTGCSLTKLLGRLKNGIRLIDRPHGQHSLVLSEDAPRYMDLRNEKIDLLEAAASSCQIYLTFPADSSTFKGLQREWSIQHTILLSTLKLTSCVFLSQMLYQDYSINQNTLHGSMLKNTQQALEQESKRLLKLQINPAMQAHYSSLVITKKILNFLKII
ncbi:hypothetical protein J5N97_001243 [Dioscorea zingiberensis]|uniref:AtC3H46-like PABC-like domain-containing protein n=1 Tax=Dioscorea zingiberensis TaxID=325984 RepID=A0A9D5BUK1_9LILI|nr:hypothetical protein J5N97_001243 [Dioscorea zingiberensis]